MSLTTWNSKRLPPTELNGNFNVALRLAFWNAVNNAIIGGLAAIIPNLNYNTTDRPRYSEKTITNCIAVAYDYPRGSGITGDGVIVFAPILDNMDSGAVPDATLWTTSVSGGALAYQTPTARTITVEANGSSGTATITSDGSTGIDLKDADSEIAFYSWGQAEQTGAISKLSIVGSTSGSVDIANLTFGGSNLHDAKMYRVVIDVAGTEAKVYYNDDAPDSPSATLDLSVLVGGSWYLESSATRAAAGNAFRDITQFARISNGDSTSELTYQSQPNTSIINDPTSAFHTLQDYNANSGKYASSVDGGSNFSSDVTYDEGAVSSLITGSSAVFRIKQTSISTITTNYPNSSAPVVYNWGQLPE